MCRTTPDDLKVPLLLTTSSEGPHVIVARTTNKDGSVSLKVTTSTTHPNGYTDVKLELYEIPESASSSVDEELGIIPNEFLSRVEYRVLPPGTLMEDYADDNTMYSKITQPKRGCDASTVRISNLRKRKRKCPDWKSIIFGLFLLVAGWVLTAAIVADIARGSLHSPKHASPSTAATAADATTTADKPILPESNTTSTEKSSSTDGNYFAPVTISHLLGAFQRQHHIGVRGK